MMAPYMIMATRNETDEDTRKIPIRNRLGGRIGSTALCSHQMNTPMNATARTDSPMMVGDPQAYWTPPHTVTSRAAVTPTSMSPAPRKSMECAWRRNGSLSTAEVTTRATMPMGTLTENIHRQIRLTDKTPP